MREPDVHIIIRGEPAPQGSKSKGKHGQMYESSANLQPWRNSVAWAAAKAMRGRPPLTGALRVEIDFHVRRPKSVKRAYPSVKPDLDKYERATFDALGKGGAYEDDGQVCDSHSRKLYAITNDFTGAVVRIWRVE